MSRQHLEASGSVMRGLTLVTIFALAQPLAAEELACPNGLVTVLSDEAALADRICRTSDQAIALFAKCGFKLASPVRIETRSEIDPECFGVFHCGEASIEVLTPAAMETLRDEDSLFAPIPTDRYFDSVVVHELAHALYDGAPCPYENCRATSEYFAYSYQIMSFTDAERAALEAGLDMERPISQDYIVGILAAMAPDAFTRRVWRHFSQRENQCAWLGGILSGAVIFDHDYP